MKWMIACLVMFCLLLGSVSLAAKGDKRRARRNQEPAASAPASAPATQASATPINKNCAVEHDNPIDPKAGTVIYKGKTIGFCCKDCIEPFQKDPEKYMKDIK